MVRALGRRINGASQEEILEIFRTFAEFDEVLAQAVQDYVDADRHLAPNQRTQTWTEIGRLFGITRQAAEQRWSPAGRERRARLQREYRERKTAALE